MLTATRSVATSLRRIVVVTILLAVFYSPAILRAQSGGPFPGNCSRCYCDGSSHNAWCVDCLFEVIFGTCYDHPWFVCDYPDIWIAA